MEQHEFIAGPNGLCDKCGKTKKDCQGSSEVYITGIPESSGIQVNKAIIFFEQIPDNLKVQQICCSKYNTFILTHIGQVYSWGETTNSLGRLLEKRDDSRIPKLIIELKSQFIVSIACGESHVLALDYEKTVWTWGFNKFGQLGHGDLVDRSVPTLIQTLKTIVKIAAAYNFSYAVSENGRVYAWGDNKNFQLGQIVDENGNKQNKFNVPRNIENLPWDKTTEIEIAGGIKNNFFYKKKSQSNKQNGASSYEMKLLQLENQELKRKLDFFTKKISILEEELYKNSTDQNSKFGISQDTALQEMKTIVKENMNRKTEIEKKMVELDAEMLKFVSEIKEVEAVIADLEQKLSGYWDEIEGKDNDFIKMQNKKVKDYEKMADLKNQKNTLLDYIKTIENTKVTYYSELHFKQEMLEQVLKTKSDLESEVVDRNKKDIVYKQLISSREKEIERNYLQKKKENVDFDLIQLIKIHSALKETSLDYISKSVTETNLMRLLEFSNSILEKLQDEIINFKGKAKKSPLKSFASLWDIIDDNINLRKEINNFTEGLLMNSVNRVHEGEVGSFNETSSKLLTPLLFARKVFNDTGIKLTTSREADFLPQSKSPIRKKLSKRQKWRFC